MPHLATRPSANTSARPRQPELKIALPDAVKRGIRRAEKITALMRQTPGHDEHCTCPECEMIGALMTGDKQRLRMAELAAAGRDALDRWVTRRVAAAVAESEQPESDGMTIGGSIDSVLSAVPARFLAHLGTLGLEVAVVDGVPRLRGDLANATADVVETCKAMRAGIVAALGETA